MRLMKKTDGIFWNLKFEAARKIILKQNIVFIDQIPNFTT